MTTASAILFTCQLLLGVGPSPPKVGAAAAPAVQIELSTDRIALEDLSGVLQLEGS